MKHVVVATVAALAFAVPASAAQAPTLTIEPTVLGARLPTPVILRGDVPGARAGTEVKIESIGCGETFYRLVGLVQTGTTGEFAWQPTGFIRSNTRFRARVGDALSAPVLLRRRVPVDLRRVASTRRFEVSVFSEFVNLHGKPVRLERFAAGRWMLIRTGKLTRGSYGTHTARFRVPTRGLQLRATIAESLVKACYAAGVSAIIKS